MERSESITKLATALVGFQSEVRTVAFDADNPFFHSKYATLSALVEATKPILSKYRLAVTQLTEDEGAVTTMLLHESGEFISSKLALKPVKDDPQGRGSCLTYARRYSYAAILGIVSDEDDDGNAATQPKVAVSKPQAKPEAKQNGVHLVTPRQQCEKVWRDKHGNLDGLNAWLIDQGVEDVDSLPDFVWAQYIAKIQAAKNARI